MESVDPIEPGDGELRSRFPSPNELRSSTAVASVLPRLANAAAHPAISPDGKWRRPLALVVGEVLPPPLLRAVNDALAAFPETAISVYGAAGANLAWIEALPALRSVRLKIGSNASLDPMRALPLLRSLELETAYKANPSLRPLEALQSLEVLELDESAKDFDVVESLPRLRHLALTRSRARSLDALRFHPSLETLQIRFGAVRDLSPLATMPSLRGVDLYGISMLLDEHIALLGDLKSLEGLNLERLPRIERLDALALGPASTLRFLHLTGLKRLTTFRPLQQLQKLEELFTRESKPADGEIATLLPLPHLRWLMLLDTYEVEQIDRAIARFDGDLFETLRQTWTSNGKRPRLGGDVRDMLRVSTNRRIYVGP
jgi:hypothetical protein